MKYTVKTIHAGDYGPVTEAVMFDGGIPEKMYTLPSLIFALTDENGEVIICDLSFGDPGVSTKVMAATPYPVDVTREKPLDQLVRDNGIEPNNVKTVLLSHHHWDHAGGGWAFPNAKVYIQKTDWEYAMTHPNYGPEFEKELKDLEGRLVLIDGYDNTTFPGIEMVPVGAHTVGSQVFFVDTPDGKVCMAFDVIMCKRNIEEKIPIGLAFNPKEAKEALDMILAKNCVKVYCGHEIVD